MGTIGALVGVAIGGIIGYFIIAPLLTPVITNVILEGAFAICFKQKISASECYEGAKAIIALVITFFCALTGYEIGKG